MCSHKHKEKIDGITMKWTQSNTLNRIDKPKVILKRMQTLHNALEVTPPDFCYFDATIASSEGRSKRAIKDFADAVEEYIQDSKKQKMISEENQVIIEDNQTPETQLKTEIKRQKGLVSIFKKNNK